MAIIAVEIVGSRDTTISIDAPMKELSFKACGSFDDEAIRAYVETQLPPSLQVTSQLFGTITIVIQSYNIKQESEGGSNWIGTAKYGRRQPRKTGDLYLTFDGTGATQHIATSLETVSKYKSEDLPETTEIPDYEMAIGVDGETVHGVDITTQICKFTLQYYPATELMTPEYIIGLITLAGKTNDEPWRDFEKGEVLFLGATGQPRSLDDWEIQMHFIASPTKEDLRVGNILGIQKRGHDYLWISFEKQVDAKKLIKVPHFAYVEQVYYEGSFSDLGLDDVRIKGLANPMTFDPDALPQGVHSLSYDATVTVTGGEEPVTLVLSGTLPTGITFSGGVFSGTAPGSGGDFPISITATDADGQTTTKAYTLSIL